VNPSVVASVSPAKRPWFGGLAIFAGAEGAAILQPSPTGWEWRC